MEATTLNVRVDKDVKNAAETIASSLGMNLSTAVNIFLRQMISHNGMPFDVRLSPNPETRQALEDARRHSHLSGPYNSLEALMEDVNHA